MAAREKTDGPQRVRVKVTESLHQEALQPHTSYQRAPRQTDVSLSRAANSCFRHSLCIVPRTVDVSVRRL